MWVDSGSDWAVLLPEFVGDRVDPERATGPWSGHRDFVYDLLQWRHPGVVVELGTHYGVSFLAMCQAIAELGIDCELNAIDTWEGDEHAGFYGEEVIHQLEKSLSALPPLNVHLHRSTFEAALPDFRDGSIDLLHIDGFHSYEALKDDFESWLPKVAPNGLVLLHDVNAASGYGSAKYYEEEIADRYPGFAFDHNFGLGVVLPHGAEGWDFLLSSEFARWRCLYERSARARELGRVAQGQAAMIDARDEAISAQETMITERDQLLSSQDRMISERGRMISERDRMIFEQGATLEKMRWEIDSRDAALNNFARQLRQAQDRVVQLSPLEVSPKVQLRALRRSVPRSLEKRARAFRTRHSRSPRSTADAKEAVRRESGPGLRTIENTSASLESMLRDLLGARFDSDRTSIDQAIRIGEPLVEASESFPLPGPDGQQQNEPARLHVADGVREAPLSELLSSHDADLLTFDIWDTLIERRRPADAAKTATARRMVLMPHRIPGASAMTVFEVADLRVQVEVALAQAHPAEEYELSDVLCVTLERLGVDPGAACRALAADLTLLEVEDEIRWSRPRLEVARTVTEADSDVVLVSDFYMTSEHLGRVVSEVAEVNREVVVSADRGVSKRLDGLLFESVRRERGVSADRHLHVGDNPHSDVANQLSSGGAAIHLARSEVFPAPGSFTATNLAPCWDVLTEHLAALGQEHDDTYRRAGNTLAPLAVCLTVRGIEEAIRRGVDRVHYVSREGAFLQQVHQLVEPIVRPPSHPGVLGIHLAVSRRSTFAASLEEPFFVALQRMWSMYAHQTVAAMLVSVGLDPALHADELDRVGLAPDTQLADASRDPRVLALLDSPVFADRLGAQVADSRSLLHDYLNGVTDLTEPFVLVDIGWRGSIQDNIVRALDLRSTVGVYLGLFPFLNAQLPGEIKIGLAFDGNAGEEFGFAEPPAALERPWTPDTPSTIGYRREGDRVVPIHDREQGAVSAGIEAFQQGTLEAAPVVAEWLVGMGLTTDLVHADLGRLARRVWLDPPEGLADIWFESDHDDSFGALNLTSFGKERPGPDWYQGSLRSHLRRGEEISGWPAGYRSWTPVRRVIELANAWGAR